MWIDRNVTLPDGTRIAYVEAGIATGTVVLYMHGTPSSRMQVIGQVDAAATELGLRLVAPDRPGLGGSSFVRYRVIDYPGIVARFVDALGIGEFGVVGTSGGGRYTCACASMLAGRVRRAALVASTASPDLPGARQTWNKQDRQAYALATRAPWLFRAFMAKVACDVRRDPNAVRSLLPPLAAADEDTLQRAEGQALMRTVLTEAFRQGGRGVAQDYRLEALPWDVRLPGITVPMDVWHGSDDTIVGVEASAVLISAIPGAERHVLGGEGHFSTILGRAANYLAPFQ